MSSIGTRLAVLSAMALFGGAANAASPLSFPRSNDPRTVADWLNARTDMPLEAVVVSGPDAVFAVLPGSAPPSAAQGRRARVLQEVIDPGFVATLGGRSGELDLDVDCVGRKVLRQAYDIYAGSNLGGAVEHLGAGKTWSQTEPDTPMDAVVTAVCQPESAPRPLMASLTVAVAAPPARAAPISEIELKPPPVAPKPAAKPKTTAPAPQPRLAMAAAPMLNLGEFSSLEAARAAWVGAAAGSSGKVQRIELASGGGAVKYRALVDGYADAPEAEAACAAVKARGGSCSLR